MYGFVYVCAVQLLPVVCAVQLLPVVCAVQLLPVVCAVQLLPVVCAVQCICSGTCLIQHPLGNDKQCWVSRLLDYRGQFVW